MGGLLYGTIVSAAALALGVNQGDTVQSVLDAMAATLVIYWLAHVYTETVGGRAGGAPGTFRHRAAVAMWRESSIMIGGMPALVVVASLAIAGVSLWVDVLSALSASIGMLIFGGYMVGRNAGMNGWKLVGESIGAAAFGGLLAVLLVWLHWH
jgi:hypothetical protein